MLYCSWDMVCDGCNFYLLFWDIFCYAVSEIWCVMDVIIYFGLLFVLLPPPSPPPNRPKYQNFYKNKKKHMEISSFYTCITKIMIRWCTISEIWCAMNRQTDRQTEKVTYRGRCPTHKNQLQSLKESIFLNIFP